MINKKDRNTLKAFGLMIILVVSIIAISNFVTSELGTTYSGEPLSPILKASDKTFLEEEGINEVRISKPILLGDGTAMIFVTTGGRFDNSTTNKVKNPEISKEQYTEQIILNLNNIDEKGLETPKTSEELVNEINEKSIMFTNKVVEYKTMVASKVNTEIIDTATKGRTDRKIKFSFNKFWGVIGL